MARSILAVPALASFASILLVPCMEAQRHAPAAEVLYTRGLPVEVELDADTGKSRVLSAPARHTIGRSIREFRTGGRVQPGTSPAQAALELSFDNTVDDDCCWDALVHPAGQEIYDWGIKTGGGSGFVERIVIGYSSRALSTTQGGPGGAFTFRLYEGGQGFGRVGRKILELELSGLFSSGTSVSVAPVILNIDLGSHAFVLPDGPIAWSIENPDGDTGPLLVDVGREQGTQNFYDVYERNAAGQQRLMGTFSLPPGGVSIDPWENTFWFQLYENVHAPSRGALPTGSAAGAGPIQAR